MYRHFRVSTRLSLGQSSVWTMMIWTIRLKTFYGLTKTLSQKGSGRKRTVKNWSMTVRELEHPKLASKWKPALSTDFNFVEHLDLLLFLSVSFWMVEIVSRVFGFLSLFEEEIQKRFIRLICPVKSGVVRLQVSGWVQIVQSYIILMSFFWISYSKHLVSVFRFVWPDYKILCHLGSPLIQMVPNSRDFLSKQKCDWEITVLQEAFVKRRSPRVFM